MSELALNLIRQAKAKGWKKLDLGNTRLYELPEELFELEQLETLIISNEYRDFEKKDWANSVNTGRTNYLKGKLPLYFARLQNLKALYIGGGRSDWKINDIQVLKNLTNLNTLDLRFNQISNIEVLAKLTNLTTLDLSFNQITDIRVLEKLTQLTTLDLSSNQITDIRVLENLTQLTTLDLSFNQITDIRVLEKLTQLTTLYLSDNQTDIRVLEKLTQLTTLYLNSNQITDIRVLEKLTQLTTLDLSSNQITDIRVLEKLTQLTTLYLNSNQITDIRVLEKLTQLTTLYLNSNQITDIRVLENLTQLTTLYLNSNQITDIRVLENLTQLTTLDLSSNKEIKNFAVLEKLTNLSSLYLSDNKIKDIEVLEKLTSLNVLALTHNQIEDISPLHLIIERGVPVKWADDYLRNGIYLESNPLEVPPVEVVKEGNAAILNYFKELEEGEETVYEAKLLILGEAGAGKTTLSRKIENAKAEMPDEVVDTTTGIHIRVQLLEGSEKKENFTMYVWDFGGQEIYHATHQFFLSKRSLYVLLADGRREESLDYWLQVQELFGKDSPLLIVFNQKGTIHQDVPIAEIRSFYNNVIDFRKVNLKNDITSIKSLQEHIEYCIRHLPHLERGEKVPKKWATVRKALADIPDNHISVTQFRTICKAEGLDTRKRQDFLSDYLHDLGVLLHFREVPSLNKLVILKPEWATDAVYRVLDHTKQQNNAGHFTRQDLTKVWNCEDYLDYSDELLQLMEQFELCYPLPEDKNQFIVPQLLPNDKPVYQWDNRQNLQLVYAYDFLPKGIVTRLIVRLHGLLENQQNVWKRGAIFQYDGTRTEVIENQRDKRITIKAKGLNPRGLVSIVAKEMDAINSTFHFNERMKVKKLVPCNCPICISRTDTGEEANFYEYTDLILRKERGKRTIECKYSYEDVDVWHLLEDVFIAVVENKDVYSEKEKEGLKKSLVIMIKRLNDYRQDLAVAADSSIKFTLKMQIETLQEEIDTTKQKLKELE